MVSLNPNPPQTFHFFDPFHMEDQSKKVRKPYTITKSRENWTDQEHDKFLEALHLYVFCFFFLLFNLWSIHFVEFTICS